MATAQGVTLLAAAGYDAGEAAAGWRHIWRITNDLNRENERVMGAMPGMPQGDQTMTHVSKISVERR